MSIEVVLGVFVVVAILSFRNLRHSVQRMEQHLRNHTAALDEVLAEARAKKDADFFASLEGPNPWEPQLRDVSAPAEMAAAGGDDA